MAAKHPSAQVPDVSGLGAANVGPVLAVTADDIRASVASFNRHSGAGPSGLRPLHLKEALGPASADQVLDHLSNVINLLIRGQAHRDIAPWLCGALLMALPKKDGSARPIAVGEVLRRLAAKSLCATTRDQNRDYLRPLQIGVAVPLRAEVGCSTLSLH